MKDAHEPLSESNKIPSLKSAFLNECVRVPVKNLVPLKKLRPAIKASKKYCQILSSVQELGLIEPPAIVAAPKQPGFYLLLDGHLRVEALKDTGVEEVDCMMATDDDTYSYNKRISRLSAVQDHKMIVKAMEHGVSAERLGKSLGLSAETIRQRFRMLNGICDEAVELLADRPCPAKTFEVLRQMKPLRQIEASELMISSKNYSVMFVNCMLASTPQNQMISDTKLPSGDHVSVESMARLERELAVLQMQSKAVEDTYGPDVLHLTIIRGYLTKLLANAAVVRWLAKHQPEYLKEFQNITEMMELPSKAKVLQ